MAKMERYLLITPTGKVRWLETERKTMMKTFREAIGCDCLENVYLKFGLNCFVDESGKCKNPPQHYNPFASMFYNGFFFGDPLCGPVVFFHLGLVDGEYDVTPLDVVDLATIARVTGLEIPE